MDQRQLLDQIGMLDEAGIRQVATGIREVTGTAAGEVAWWRATIAVEREVRRSRVLAVAGMVSHRAATAVTDRAGSLGVPLPDPDVTTVARTASEAARALVAGGYWADEVLGLFRPCWAPVNNGHGPIWSWTAA
jgi:hypothetical protein